MTVLKDRLVDLAEKAGRDLRAVHARIDGDLATVEKTNLAAAISEVVRRLPAVGTAPPSSPSVNDLWIDTN